ncbi:diguanylate cyclase/phosphodiesterase (GGDEF & EAL domains) with PAS/PAC sensor(s) [Rhodovulum sp. P5]|uniref:EAL domain-containing protein n=1 Tax=Rhodovulum sp. P5 TaxID=1564506 RepID=UPI0009C24D71|nr:EAL domain-containing protein [Rhodovulum sp. P5]ARE40785.1 diguanylate cyclase/phosphodiesterase (GGDEF & EAL domains) with PAS/PAC sensor(s) [Rhodovulum sp. P5]
MKASISRTIVSAVIAAAVIGLVLGMVQHQHTLKKAVADVRADTYAATDQIELLLRSLRLSAETVADRLDTGDLATSGQPAMEAIRKENIGLNAVLVIDADGIVVDELFPGGTALGLDVSDRAYFRVHRDGEVHSHYMGAPIRNRFNGAWSLPVSVAVRDSSGAFAGVVTVGVLQDFFAQLKTYLSADDSEIYFRVRPNGAFIALSGEAGAQDFAKGIADVLGGDTVRGEVGAGVTRLNLAGGTAFLRESPSGLFDVVVVRPDAGLQASALAAGVWAGLGAFLLAAIVLLAAVALRWSGAQARQAAEDTRVALDRLNRLADNTPGVLSEFTISETGEIDFVYFSAKMPAMMGITADALMADGRAIVSRVPEDDVGEIFDAFERTARDLKTLTFRHRVLHPETGLRWILATCSPERAANGTIRYFASNVDITDQVEAERRLAEAGEALRIAHERLNTLNNNSATALFEYRISAEGEIDVPYFSDKLPEITGVSRAEIEADGAAFERHVHPDDFFGVHATLEKAGRDLTPVTFKHRLNHPTNGLRWVLASVTPSAQPDGAIVFYSSMLDITDQMSAEERAAQAGEELKRAHEQLNSVANVAPVGIYQFRLCPDGTGDFPYTSGRFEELVGYTREEIAEIRLGVFDRILPEDRERVLATTVESARTLEPWAERFRVQHPDRGVIWLSASSIPRRAKDGSAIFAGALLDVTADVEREEELRRAHRVTEEMRAENERQALHDGLTGLPNRRHYDKTLDERLHSARGDGPQDCVLIRIDLDHFKYVNDTLGHEAGDLVLMRVADVLRDCLRGSDFAARIGGDEFTVLMAPGASEADAIALVERIRAQIEVPLLYEGRQCRFGASFGVAHIAELAQVGEDIQMFADAALYRAKEGGRNRSELFTPDLHRQIQHDRRLAVEIHEALDNDQFVPFFQPQVAAEGGRLVGVETLLRWNHPTDGLLAPDAFMNVAEQLRLVADIDRIMMEKSRDALSRWRARGLIMPKISFNVSSGRMHDPDVVALASEMAAEETKVTFELLESILVEEESEAFKFHLGMLREAGIDIEIDDFGSGHASIIGVMEIAPSALKIDKRIVMPLEDDLRNRSLVRAIVEIAETLGIETVAEGVETQEQADILRGIGCTVLQGYLFAKPLTEEALLAFALGSDRRTA